MTKWVGQADSEHSHHGTDPLNMNAQDLYPTAD
jgi:hypothetical protein